MENAVLLGKGKLIIGKKAWNDKMRKFLKSVPDLMVSKSVFTHKMSLFFEYKLKMKWTRNSTKIHFLQSDIESLHNAAQSGDLSKVKELIGKNKRLIYSRDASGASALHKAAKDGHIEVVKHILSENPESAKVTDDVSSLFVTNIVKYIMFTI